MEQVSFPPQGSTEQGAREVMAFAEVTDDESSQERGKAMADAGASSSGE